MAKVVVGLSGGVDSSVAAHLLKEQGHDVIGVFMKNWHDTEFTISDDCPWEEDSKDALLVSEKLGIPFHTLDLSEDYYERIVQYMFDEYSAGRTPNPDVLCNREIKFDLFLKHALKLDADFVATGHYCRKVENDNGTFDLLKGMDENKDQSYFLCQISQDQLSKALFPLGELKKDEVREIAAREELITAEKRDSQGLCFIGKVKLPDFLKQRLSEKQGEVVEIKSNWQGYDGLEDPLEVPTYNKKDGSVIGQHQGAHFYTVGQRKGLNIGGYKEPLFILQTDTKSNTVYVGEGANHKGLLRKGLTINNNDVHWVKDSDRLSVGESKSFDVRIRYRQPLFKAVLSQKEDHMEIVFDDFQKAVAPGQFAVWYEGDKLIGSGVIE